LTPAPGVSAASYIDGVLAVGETSLFIRRSDAKVEEREFDGTYVRTIPSFYNHIAYAVWTCCNTPTLFGVRNAYRRIYSWVDDTSGYGPIYAGSYPAGVNTIDGLAIVEGSARSVYITYPAS